MIMTLGTDVLIEKLEAAFIAFPDELAKLKELKTLPSEWVANLYAAELTFEPQGREIVALRERFLNGVEQRDSNIEKLGDWSFEGKKFLDEGILGGDFSKVSQQVETVRERMSARSATFNRSFRGLLGKAKWLLPELLRIGLFSL
jgi:hypothetical protein